MSGELTRDYMESLLKAHIDPIKGDVRELRTEIMEQRREAAACRARSDNQFAALYKQDHVLDTRIGIQEDRAKQQQIQSKRNLSYVMVGATAMATALGALLSRAWIAITGG